MKKLSVFLSAVCVFLLMSSCTGGKGGDEGKVTLTVETELGNLGDYLSVTDKEVTVTLSDEKGDKTDGEKEAKDYKVVAASLALNVNKAVASNYSFKLEVEVLDENHIKIGDLPSFTIDGTTDLDNGDLDNVLAKGQFRAQMKDGVTTDEWESGEGQKMWEKICKEGKYIVVKADNDAKFAEYTKSESSETASEDESSVDSGDGDGDFDEWLDSYEEFCDDYMALLKKAANGDMDAVAEYPEILKKAQELGEKMQSAQEEATAEQWARYLKIQQKLMKAAADQ